MMDAFEDIRERLNRATDTEAAFPPDEIDKFVSPGAQQATEDVARLLSAVDALMGVVRAVDKADLSGSGYFHVFEAMDALPPELKEVVE